MRCLPLTSLIIAHLNAESHALWTPASRVGLSLTAADLQTLHLAHSPLLLQGTLGQRLADSGRLGTLCFRRPVLLLRLRTMACWHIPCRHAIADSAHGNMHRDLCSGGLLLYGSQCMLVLPLLCAILCTIDKALRRLQPTDDVKVPGVPQENSPSQIICQRIPGCVSMWLLHTHL